jgi:deoxycytidine triphosphate deaminase
MKKSPKISDKREPVANAEDLARIKRELLIGINIESLVEQPHGIDFDVYNIITMESGKPESIQCQEKTGEDGEKYYVAKLEAGKEYVIGIEPHLKIPWEEINYRLVLFPRSSLLRAGIECWPESFSGGLYGKEQKALGRLPSERPRKRGSYETGRHTTYRIKILNPNGVEIEANTPIVQVLFRSKHIDATKTSQGMSEETGDNLTGNRESLHLGQVLRFNQYRPHLSKNRKRQQLNVTEPLESTTGNYLLRRGVPYLLRTEETVALSDHEIGTTQGLLRQPRFSIEEHANGSALVDAGYTGKLTYLIVPKKDIVLKEGEKIAVLLKTPVPATRKTYHGQWK